MYGLHKLNELTLEQAALAYASMGWPVLPLTPRDKTPLGKLVRTGLKEATTDLGQVRTWWEMYPAANIGLRTGDAFDVVDLDGDAAIASLRGLAPGYKHPGPVSATGKGYHLLFQPTGARNAAARLPGIDFRGQSGYIVAPPSVHPNGHRYVWAKDGELPAPTAWLDTIVTPERKDAFEGGMYDPEDLEDIVDVWLRTFGSIDEHKLGIMGERYITACPWHEDSTPSLVLYPDNNSFFCFGCHEWGDSLNITASFMTHGGQAPSITRATSTRVAS